MSNRRIHLIFLGLLVLITALAFARGMSYDFLKNWDDGIFILENRHLDFSWKNLAKYGLRSYRQLYTPLPMYSLMVDKALFGIDSAVPYHIHNLLLHIGCVILLYLIALKLDLPPPMAFLVALLWAVNPQKNESVVWITERKDVQCGLFALAGFYSYLWCLDEKCRWWHLVLASLFTALSLGSKPIAAPLVGIFVVYALMVKRWHWRLLWPVLVTLLAIIWTAIMTGRNNPGQLEPSLLVPLHNLFWYPVTAIIPAFDTVPIYPTVGTLAENWRLLIFAPLAIVAILVGAWKIKGVKPLTLLYALMILGGSLLPVLGLWQYTNFNYCDRYNYLVSAVTLLLLAPLCPSCPRTWFAGGLVAAAMLLAGQLDMKTWSSSRNVWLSCMSRPGRINAKVFEMGATDSMMREDYADLGYVITKLEEQCEALNQPNRQVEHTIMVLRAHLHFSQGEYQRGAPYLRQLASEEFTSGAEIKFMRGKNYPVIYKEHLRVLKLLEYKQLKK